ncbi:MAG: TolC family protein [Bacteroidota bacterium]|nr:TolC family protein [Bacteroidota bacterium]
MIRIRFLKLKLLFIFLMGLTIVQAQQLTRSSLIEKAIEKSYDIRNQKDEAQKSHLDQIKAKEIYIPNVTINSSYTLLNDDINMVIPPIKIPLTLPGLPAGYSLEPKLDPIRLQNRDILKTDVTAQMILFTGLKAPMLSQAAMHKEKALAFLTEQMKSQIILDVITAYDRLALIDQSEIVLKESSKRLDEESAVALKAKQVGLITSYDMTKIDVARQELKSKQVELNSGRKLAAARLRQLTGVSEEVIVSIHPSLLPCLLVPADSTVDNRAELKALNEVEKAADYKTKADKGSYLPTVAAYGKRELIKQDLSVLDPLWAVGVGLKWSVFDGLQNYREIQKSKIDQDIARNNSIKTKELLALNLEQARLNLDQCNELISVSAEKRKYAQQALDISRNEYKNGLNTITELLASETEFQKTSLDYQQAVYNQRLSTLQLLEATGNLNLEQINKYLNE